MSKPLTKDQLETLYYASCGEKMTAREVASLERRGLLIRDRVFGWCHISPAGKAALDDARARGFVNPTYAHPSE